MFILKSDKAIQEGAKPAILFLGSQMETGGAQRVLLTQAEWFFEKGYDVIAAFLYDKEGLHEQWARHYHFPIIDLNARAPESGWLKNIFRLLGGIARLVKLVFSKKYTGIETFTHHSNLIGLPVAAAARIPVRIASHHGWINRFPRWLERLHTMLVNSRMATCLVVVSEGVYKAAVEEKIDPAKIITILNGISMSVVEENARMKTRAFLGIPEDASLIITVGRLSFEKGHIFLIQSIPEVLEKYPDARFLIAGDGLLRKELEAEAEKLGVSGALRFLGVRTDVPDLLAAADIFVLPSRSEGLSMAMLEAMGMEVPVIATDVGGISQVIEDQRTGVLISPADPLAMARAINDLLGDGAKRARLAATGKELVQQNYSLEKMCLEYEHLLAGEKRKHCETR